MTEFLLLVTEKEINLFRFTLTTYRHFLNSFEANRNVRILLEIQSRYLVLNISVSYKYIYFSNYCYNFTIDTFLIVHIYFGNLCNVKCSFYIEYLGKIFDMRS